MIVMAASCTRAEIIDFVVHHPYWAGVPAPQHYAAPQTLPGDTLKNPQWLAARPLITGAGSAGKCALHSYLPSFPVQQWEFAVGLVADEFKGNVDTAYG